MQNTDSFLPTIWTVSVTRLSSLMREVTPDFDGRAHIETIDLGFEEAVTHIRERLRSEDCDIVLSAGSNGEYLRNRIDKPIVLVRPDGFDLMQALTRARRHSDRIGIISYGAPLPAFAAFKQQFGLQIEQRAYSNTEEARDLVAELVSIGCGAIVGTGYVSELADKAGVAGMTRALARELGSRNITVNCVAPGFIETDMTASLPEAQQQALLSSIPLGHLGKPADIAHAVA